VHGLSLGVLNTSRKENEHRLPIHPRHLRQIPSGLRSRMTFETGYGSRFGLSADDLASAVGAVSDREQVIASADVVLLPKITVADVAALKHGQVLWGWPHCVQDSEITQVAIDAGATLIAWEAMHEWSDEGLPGRHVFAKNNEIAGYCSILHAMTLVGLSGQYGRQLRAAVVGSGNSAKGAVTALHGLGVKDVTVLTQRSVTSVSPPISDAVLYRIDRPEPDSSIAEVLQRGRAIPTAEFLGQFDIIANCVLQDTDAPLMFIDAAGVDALAPGTLIVDISCDEGMGFACARPTSFADPMFAVGNGAHYYAVDHSPSYLWDSATWDISRALMPFLGTVMAGPQAWQADSTIDRAIEIRDGVIKNRKILAFQRRAAAYPHRQVTAT
jgi:alanine dehydrogenase